MSHHGEYDSSSVSPSSEGGLGTPTRVEQGEQGLWGRKEGDGGRDWIPWGLTGHGQKWRSSPCGLDPSVVTLRTSILWPEAAPSPNSTSQRCLQKTCIMQIGEFAWSGLGEPNGM